METTGHMDNDRQSQDRKSNEIGIDRITYFTQLKYRQFTEPSGRGNTSYVRKVYIP